MLYQKNLPPWERWGRALAGLGLIALGAAVAWGTPAGWIIAGLGAMILLTGFVGFCPMCAMVGRRLPMGSRR